MPEESQKAAPDGRCPGGLRPSASGYFICATLHASWAPDADEDEASETYFVAWTARARVAASARLRLLSIVPAGLVARQVMIGVKIGDDDSVDDRARWHAHVRQNVERGQRGCGRLHDAVRIAAAAAPAMRRLEAEADADEARDRIFAGIRRRYVQLANIGLDGEDPVNRPPQARMVADVGQVLASVHAILDVPAIDESSFGDEELIRWRADGRARLLAFQEAAAPMLRWAVEHDCLDGEVMAGEREPRFAMSATWAAWAAVGRGTAGEDLVPLLREAADELTGVRGRLVLDASGDDARADAAAQQPWLFDEGDVVNRVDPAVSAPKPPRDPLWWPQSTAVLNRVLRAFDRGGGGGERPGRGAWYVWAHAPGDLDEPMPREAYNLLLGRAADRDEADRLVAALLRAYPVEADGLPTFSTFAAGRLDDADRVLLDAGLGDDGGSDSGESLRADAGLYLAAIRQSASDSDGGPPSPIETAAVVDDYDYDSMLTFAMHLGTATLERLIDVATARLSPAERSTGAPAAEVESAAPAAERHQDAMPAAAERDVPNTKLGRDREHAAKLVAAAEHLARHPAASKTEVARSAGLSEKYFVRGKGAETWTAIRPKANALRRGWLRRDDSGRPSGDVDAAVDGPE